MSKIRKIVRDFTPPICLRFAKLLIRGNSNAVQGKEQPAEYYDQTFSDKEHWKSHYTESHYFPLWTVVADRMRGRGNSRILDIGCGPGQVACMIKDTPGIDSYVGVDFSSKRIAQARLVCPEYDFFEVDVFNTDMLETLTYDTVLIMEFLEHIEQDLKVLERLKQGSYVLATVPNFPSAGHVRFFETVQDVESRYRKHLGNIRVDEIIADNKGMKYFIVEGFVQRSA